MKLSIFSIKSTIFEGEVKSISFPTLQGEITVLENHLPLITLVSRGILRYTDSRDEEYNLLLNGGIIEVRPQSEVVILAEEKKE